MTAATKRRKPEVPELYQNSVQVDPTTGAPADYNSLALAYRKLAFLCAKQCGIPPQEQEDAVQAVLMRFWKNDGLSNYDPERVFLTASGQERKAKFHTMFRSYVGLSMLAERDRVLAARGKMKGLYGLPIDAEDWAPAGEGTSNFSPDPAVEVAEEDAASDWLIRAELALVEAGHKDLLPVLKLCADKAKVGGTVTRADIVAVTGVRLRAATSLLTQLQAALKSADMGPETLSDCQDY